MSRPGPCQCATVTPSGAVSSDPIATAAVSVAWLAGSCGVHSSCAAAAAAAVTAAYASHRIRTRCHLRAFARESVRHGLSAVSLPDMRGRACVCTDLMQRVWKCARAHGSLQGEYPHLADDLHEGGLRHGEERREPGMQSAVPLPLQPHQQASPRARGGWRLVGAPDGP